MHRGEAPTKQMRYAKSLDVPQSHLTMATARATRKPSANMEKRPSATLIDLSSLAVIFAEARQS
jgi:hypothetical protein